MNKLYMRCINDTCVEINWNDIEVKSKYIYIYIYTPLVHRPWTIYIGCDIVWIIGWCENLVNIMNGWLEMIDCDWNPNRISIWENSSAYELDIENPHCQKLRGFKVERGAVLGTAPILTTLPLCCRNFE